MTDPITTAILSSVARSLTSIAIQSSIPAWKQAARSAVFESKHVKKLPEWPKLDSERRSNRRLTKFLQGRLATSALEAYAIAYTSQMTLPPNEDQHFRVFAEGLSRALKEPRATSDPLATALWDRATKATHLAINSLRSSRALSPENLILYAKLTSQSGENQSSLNTHLSRRLELILNDTKSTRAVDTVARIRRASATYFSEMLMPHARQGYRINSDALYVSRELSALAIDWQQGQDSLTLKSTGSHIPENEINDKRFVIVGDPGAGKSTLVRRILHDVARDPDSEMAPILLELKTWSEDDGTLASQASGRLAATIQENVESETIEDILTLGLGFVILDGIDEVVDIGKRRLLVQAIEAFALRFPLCSVVVTSRLEGFASVKLDPILFPAFRIPQFSDEEMRSYVNKWFNVVEEQDQIEASHLRKGFISESSHATELRRNPLMLSLLCLLYQSEGYIPENRLRVYEECAELLFARWDNVRRVDTLLRREIKRHHLVEEIAHRIFTLRLGRGAGEKEVALKNFITEYFLQNLTDDRFEARAEADRFIEHCTGRAWLLTRVGLSSNGDRIFDFTHRTFMEYFAACRIARFASSPASLVAELKPLLSQGAGTVIAQLAILRYDERVVNGADTAVRLLLFGSPTLEHKYAKRALEFLAESSDSLQLAPRTQNSVWRAVLREYSKTEPGTDIGTIVAMSPASRESIAKVARFLIRTTAESGEDADAIKGARMLLKRDDKHISNPHWLIRHSQETLVVRLLDGTVPLKRYREVSGDGCLVDVGLRFQGTLRRTVAPIARGLERLSSSCFLPLILDEMFRVVHEDPSSTLPISRAAVIELSERIENIDDWTLESVLGAGRPTARQSIQGFTALCAAIALGAFDYGLRECLDAACERGVGIPVSASSIETRSDLASALRASSSIQLNDRWHATLTAWASKEPKVFSDAAGELF